MREHKYRAWDKEYKKMCDVASVDFENHGVEIVWCESSLEQMAHFVEEDKVELIQYTGLKDKNGVEICEGDIIDDGTRIGSIRYSTNAASFYFGTTNQHGVKIAITNTHSWYWNIEDETDCKIIGNIYENPKLMEVQHVVGKSKQNS